MRRWAGGLVAAALLAAGIACHRREPAHEPARDLPAPHAPPLADVPPFSLEVRITGQHLGPQWTEVSVAADGAAEVRVAEFGREPWLQRDQLEEEDLRTLWAGLRGIGMPPAADDAEAAASDDAATPPQWHPPTIHLTLRVEGREFARQVTSTERFDEPMGLLFRLVAHARLLHQLDSDGSPHQALSALRPGPGQTMHPHCLVEPLLACVPTAQLWQAHEILPALRGVLAPAPWVEAVERTLLLCTQDRRDALLGALFHVHTERGEFPEHGAALLPLARAEIERVAPRWLAEGRAAALGAAKEALALLAARGDLDTLSLVLELAQRHSTADNPYLPVRLHLYGDAALPLVLQLLTSESAGVRLAGTYAAEDLCSASRHERSSARIRLPAPEAERLARALERELAPVLERIAADVSADGAVRLRAHRLLVKMGLAEPPRPREAAAAKAPASPPDPPPPPRGPLAISGRVVGSFGEPIDGIGVSAGRDDAPEGEWRAYAGVETDGDGAFRIEGLPPGPYRVLVWTRRLGGRHGVGRDFLEFDGVHAGRSDVLLEIGTGPAFLRGVLLDEQGRPFARAQLSARMRDAPNVLELGDGRTQAWCRTDDRGAFWFVGLMPGRYDIELHDATRLLEGGADLASGRSGLALRALAGQSIGGRVVDERGAPLSDATVGARPVDEPGAEGRRSTARDDGTFEVRGLVENVDYLVAASLRCFEGTRSSSPQRVRAGGRGLELRIETGPRLSGRIVERETGRPAHVFGVELVHEPTGRRVGFRTSVFELRGAPPGTFRVSATVQRYDAQMQLERVDLELGTLEAGEEGVEFAVPR